MTIPKRLAVLLIATGAIAAPALAQARTPPTPEQRAARFDRADANKDGKLTRDEFTAALPARAAAHADRMWSRMNPSGKDSLTKAEYLAVPMGRAKGNSDQATTPKPD